MGSKAGWTSAFKGVGNILTFGYLGQKEMAKEQAKAAQQYAAGQERVASAIESTSQATPQAVQASTASTQQAAEADVYSANKRKRTVNSTQNKTYSSASGGLLGLGGRRAKL